MLMCCVSLFVIYLTCLPSGTVPEKCKLARVIPIFKTGDMSLPCNYRPISLLNVFNKILEKIVHRRLFHFLNQNKIIYKYQFGFRKYYATSLALLEVMDTCYKKIDSNNIALGVFLDLQKAFDTVDHNILLSKLQKLWYSRRPIQLAKKLS